MRSTPAAANKRNAFGKLITLLYKLGVTKYVHIPTVSNTYNLFKMTEEEEKLVEFFRKKSKR